MSKIKDLLPIDDDFDGSDVGDLHSQLAREARAEYELNVSLLEYFEAKGFTERWEFTTEAYAKAADIFDRNQSTDELPFKPQERYNDE